MRKHSAITIFLLILAIVINSSIAYAAETYYRLNYEKWSNNSCKMDIDHFNSLWYGQLSGALSAWNYTGSKFSFSEDGTSSSYITYTNSVPSAYDGWLCWEQSYLSGSSGSYRLFSQSIITFNLQQYSWSDTLEAGKFHIGSVARHELGHSLGLGDVPVGSMSDAIMYGYFSAATAYNIKTADINGQKYIYGTN